jgi:hypothetical protein
MCASMIYTLSRSVAAAMIGAWVAVGAPASARANVITDWDEKAIAAVTPMASFGGTSPYMAQRMMAMVHAAMFDAVQIRSSGAIGRTWCSCLPIPPLRKKPLPRRQPS